ncbi:MAG: hypothetical protein COU25_03775 [Candidatus Levybacteria bacterium CG10_big_fil_rev_8_21_14_0_10_35_13]|nr:MAG: hypothetical protein COU25_03775 [Candidatus Levybacteria bacterium CG10_big_fil_rev_8_21_14_0_10_35_13]
MPHVSKRKLDKLKEEELVHSFNLVLAKISNEKEMQDFLGSLLTITERVMLAKRLAIAILLKEGISQNRISSALNVTQATVSRMQLFLEVRGQGYNIAFKKLISEKILAEFKKYLLKLASYSIRAAGGYVKPEII